MLYIQIRFRTVFSHLKYCRFRNLNSVKGGETNQNIPRTVKHHFLYVMKPTFLLLSIFPIQIFHFQMVFQHFNSHTQKRLNTTTQNDSTQWTRCVVCAVARRKEGLFGLHTKSECQNCFKRA